MFDLNPSLIYLFLEKIFIEKQKINFFVIRHTHTHIHTLHMKIHESSLLPTLKLTENLITSVMGTKRNIALERNALVLSAAINAYKLISAEILHLN